MDIRTKLVFALVGVAIVSMASLGTVAYVQSSRLLRESSLRQLDALAESRRQDLQNIVAGWADRVRLIGSRTQLRESLGDAEGSAPAVQERQIHRILADAARSVPLVLSLAVYDRTGRPVASVPNDAPALPAMEIFPVHQDDTRLRFLGLEDDASHAHYVMPLELEGRGQVGWLEARLSTVDLAEMARDTTGLGATGETLVVGRDGDSYRLLHPTRNGDVFENDRASGEADDRVLGAVDPADVALAGRTGTLWENAVDYRGRRVWAATRYLEELDWGIVVKVDASQEEGSIAVLREDLFRGALAFAAFPILAGILLGLHLARPIHDLAEVANRIRDGDTHVRARVHHQDEIGMLARTFNRMADALTGVEIDLRKATSRGVSQAAPAEAPPEDDGAPALEPAASPPEAEDP